MNLRLRSEERDGFLDGHHEHVANALAAEFHGQRRWVEATAAAAFAFDAHVGQEAHLDALHALPFAAFAAAARGVEREAARVVAAQARFRRLREQLAHLVENADIGGRARARRL